MNTEIQQEIQELNLSYLLLAQRLLQEDRASAMFRLKLNEEMADMLLTLNTRQMARLSRINQLICRPCLDQVSQFSKLLGEEREPGLAQTHAALLLAQARNQD